LEREDSGSKWDAVKASVVPNREEKASAPKTSSASFLFDEDSEILTPQDYEKKVVEMRSKANTESKNQARELLSRTRLRSVAPPSNSSSNVSSSSASTSSAKSSEDFISAEDYEKRIEAAKKEKNVKTQTEVAEKWKAIAKASKSSAQLEQTSPSEVVSAEEYERRIEAMKKEKLQKTQSGVATKWKSLAKSSTRESASDLTAAAAASPPGSPSSVSSSSSIILRESAESYEKKIEALKKEKEKEKAMHVQSEVTELWKSITKTTTLSRSNTREKESAEDYEKRIEALKRDKVMKSQTEITSTSGSRSSIRNEPTSVISVSSAESYEKKIEALKKEKEKEKATQVQSEVTGAWKALTRSGSLSRERREKELKKLGTEEKETEVKEIEEQGEKPLRKQRTQEREENERRTAAAAKVLESVTLSTEEKKGLVDDIEKKQKMRRMTYAGSEQPSWAQIKAAGEANTSETNLNTNLARRSSSKRFVASNPAEVSSDIVLPSALRQKSFRTLSTKNLELETPENSN